MKSKSGVQMRLMFPEWAIARLSEEHVVARWLQTVAQADPLFRRGK
jgi:hypothetical protein